MRPIVKPHKDGIQVRDPYYEPLMNLLSRIELLLNLPVSMEVGDIPVTELFGKIVVELTDKASMTIPLFLVAWLLILKAKDKIYRWAIINLSEEVVAVDEPLVSVD